MSSDFTAAILLGASNYPKHDYGNSTAFLRSKQDFHKYLQDADTGLGLLDEAILDLFNSPYPSSSQVLQIGQFLDGITRKVDRLADRNLVIYYVGHGYFAGQSYDYHLALADLVTGYESITGLRMAGLGDVLKHKAGSFRRFLVLDCCFAAAAFRHFQGTVEDVIRVEAMKAFGEDIHRRAENPKRGCAMLCASPHDSVALAPAGMARTMFSEALLYVLRNGDAQYPPFLNLAQLKELTWERLRNTHGDPVRPVLHSPDQSHGDIATVAFFPNSCRKSAGRKTNKASAEPTPLVKAVRQLIQRARVVDPLNPKHFLSWYPLNCGYQKVRQGDEGTQLSIARMYAFGRGVPKDVGKAFKWSRKGAEQGHRSAQYFLGFLYLKGDEDGARNYLEAARWFRKAAEQGYGDAQLRLGAMYAAGIGVPKSIEQAVSWLRMAAHQGVADAQWLLGDMCSSGLAVPKEEAKTWLSRAAKQGHLGAKASLKLQKSPSEILAALKSIVFSF